MKEPAERRLRRVTVDGNPVKVLWNQKMARDRDGYPTDGDYKAGVVRMGRGLRRHDKRQVLWHELMHDCWARAGLPGFFSSAQEETVISSLSPWLLTMLRENLELVDHLTEAD